MQFRTRLIVDETRRKLAKLTGLDITPRTALVDGEKLTP
jgi:hypothetical protein